MTLDDQLREMAHRADQHQGVITAEEIVRRAASQDRSTFATGSPSNDDRKAVSLTPVQLIDEETTTIDLQTPSQTDEGRKTTTRVVRAGLLAAAAAVAVVLVAIRIDDARSSVDPLSPTVPVTVATTAPPSSTTSEPASSDRYGQNSEQLTVGVLEPGTYAYLNVDKQGFNVRFTVPAGWTWNGRYLSKGGIDLPNGAAIFFFGGPVEVYDDPCHWIGSGSALSTGSDVAALLSVQPMRNATEQTARSVPYPTEVLSSSGTIVGLTVPDDVDFAGCDGGQFRSWGPESKARSHQGPGQRDLVWGVNISGAGDTPGNPPRGGLIIDAASFAGTPPDVSAEIDAILESIAAGHWG